MTKRFFIFDMDGVLIDSEPLHNQIIDIVFNELNLSFSKSYRESLTGMAGIPMWKKIVEDKKLNQNHKELLDFHRKLFFKELPNQKIKMVDGILPLIKQLKDNNYHLAVASSSETKLIDYFLNHFEIKSFFEVIVSGESLPQSKPAPDIFLKTANLLGASPKECIVLEDSKNGVTAAKSAGMKCIGFINPNSGNQDLSKADWLIKSISEITIEHLKSLNKNI